MNTWKSLYKEKIEYANLSPKEEKSLEIAKKYLIYYVKQKGLSIDKAVLAVDDSLTMLDIIAQSGKYNSSISGTINKFFNKIFNRG